MLSKNFGFDSMTLVVVVASGKGFADLFCVCGVDEEDVAVAALVVVLRMKISHSTFGCAAA